MSQARIAPHRQLTKRLNRQLVPTTEETSSRKIAPNRQIIPSSGTNLVPKLGSVYGIGDGWTGALG
jgi:hypothetical protein